MMRAVKGEERALWREAMRDVRSLRGSFQPAREAASPEQLPAEIATLRLATPKQAPGTPIGDDDTRIGRGLDRRTAQKLKRGQLPIAARLDLHGMTQDEAHRALNRFIAASAAAGRRVLLVITGKSGVLRRMVPLWLEEGENRARLLSMAPAHHPHGGAGALYVLLRRAR